MSGTWMSAGGLAAAVLALGVAGCGTGAGSAPDKDPAAAAASGSARGATVDVPPTASATASVAPAPKVPTLVKVEVKRPAGAGSLYPIEGALMTSVGRKVGRIVGDQVEWVGEVPPGQPTIGENGVDDVSGRWPDGIDAYYSMNNGRAPSPTYMPITGKGRRYALAEGGGWGILVDLVRARGSTFLAAESGLGGGELVTVRGTAIAPKQQSAKDYGCTREEIVRSYKDDWGPAVGTYGAAASEDGTILKMGELCERRGPAAEVWGPTAAKSTIVDLKRWIPDVDYFTNVVGGPGDEVWIAHPGSTSLARYKGGSVENVPAPEGGKVRAVFASRAHQIHVLTGFAIHRREGDAWALVAKVPWPLDVRGFTFDDDGALWVRRYGGYDKLGPGENLTEWREDCTTPFVYMYEVSSKNPPKFDFPGTRKALSTFAEASQISLLDFEEDGTRSLGIAVTSKAQGEAVIAHVKANMKDEEPRLLCFAPKSPRKVELSGGKK